MGAAPRCMSTTRTEAARFTARVSAADSGMRLDEYLARHVPDQLGPVSRSTIRRAIVAGSVAVDRLCVRRPAWTLASGSRVVAHIETARIDQHRVERRRAEQPLDVVFEDEWLLVVNKPSGLPTHAAADPRRPHLVGMVEKHLRRASSAAAPPGVHQRLDRDTSGLVLFTKHPDANRGLARQFAAHTVQKAYLALVARPSQMPPREWTSDEPVVSAGSLRSAHTDFRVVKATGGLLLIEARPRTGRKHQIRIHLARVGLPILGDVRYGGKAADDGRMMLHASKLILQHPITGDVLAFECPLPADCAARLSAAPPRHRQGWAGPRRRRF